MNQLNKYCCAIIIIMAVAFSSCKKDYLQFDLQDGKFSQPALTADKSTLVLNASQDNSNVLGFNWSNAQFGGNAIVAYTLQLDLPSDTAAPNNWKNAKTYSLSNNRSFIFLGKDLNNLLNGMGLAPGTPNSLVIRVKAEVPQINGSASAVPPIYTNVVKVDVTSYALDLYVPGDYQGWNPGAAPVISPVNGRPGMYEGYVYMPGAGTHYFKFTSAPDWNHINYGDGGNGTFSTDGLAAGLSVPDGGYYYLTANLNNNTWTATKTTWGIIGDASPGGWSNDTQMTYDPASQTWKATLNMSQNGSFKFRANNAWALDFGIDNTGKLLYADNPFLGYTPGLNNLTVPSTGLYIITLDLHVSGNYTYTMVKQ